MPDTFDKDKKPEKLASAIYLITGFLNDQEPLKWKLRLLVSEFVSLTVSRQERQVMSSAARDLILNIKSFLSIAKNVGLISAENNDLMQEELTKYIGTIDYPLSIGDLLHVESPKPDIKRLHEGSEVKDKPLREFGAVSVKKNSRQNIIITFLKRKKEAMIKDISPLIGNCSEKTIQRELSAMIKAGVLRKMGEKRWSRYSLA
ncbi:MAG: hypothetical protein HYX23_01760 [Candidatus Zambryskibacteria bacterium]|nr:hypothetical protein [Candidatus Zambryskibacteria bacterium]